MLKNIVHSIKTQDLKHTNSPAHLECFAQQNVSRDEAACAKFLKNIYYNYFLCADSSLDTILASLESLEMIGFFNQKQQENYL